MVVGTAADYVVWIEAGCLLSIIPILILYIFLQKHFVEGIERSGIVG
jgi:multiple sugar transport system permease protein